MLLRHRLVALGVLVIGVGAVPAYLLARDTKASADALVVASRLDMTPSEFADYARKTFNNGAVAAAIAGRQDSGVDPADAIPTYVSLEAEPDGVVLRVTGHSQWKGQAADFALTAAVVLAKELNKDPYVGEFDVPLMGSPAPTEEVSDGQRDDVTAVLGVGVVFGLFLAGVLLLPRTRAYIRE